MSAYVMQIFIIDKDGLILRNTAVVAVKENYMITKARKIEILSFCL